MTSHGKDSQDTQHPHAAPTDGAEDRDSVEYAIRTDLPTEPELQAEQASVFRATATIGWLVSAAGAAIGIWLAVRARTDPSPLKIVAAAIAAITGILWGRAIRSVSRSGLRVIHHSAPSAP